MKIILEMSDKTTFKQLQELTDFIKKFDNENELITFKRVV
jgi:hypothetical protein